MRAVKKPIEITVVEAIGSDLLNTLSMVKWRKTRIDGGEVYNHLHDSWIGFSFGDYLNVTNDRDVYPIQRTVFLETYDVVERS